MKQDLKNVIASNEQVIWEGKPNKKTFILESIFNPFLFVAIIWAVIDLAFINTILKEKGQDLFILIFFTIHLMPVWIYLFSVIFSLKRYSRISYLITDKGVYISGGLFSYTYSMKPFTKVTNITLHRGVFDQMTGVGDIVFENVFVNSVQASSSNNNSENVFKMINLQDYEKVYKLVKDLQTDIYSDTQFPNELRPSENKGYKTKYTKDE